MTSFSPNEIDLSKINNGQRYQNGDIVSPEAINAPIEASAYAQQKSEYAEQKSEEALTMASAALDKVNDSNIGDITLSAYPVGSIYLSVTSVSPASLFGGTWEQLKDKFLLACGDRYSNGATGGEATHTLTIDEMPSHNHSGDSLFLNANSSSSNWKIPTEQSISGNSYGGTTSPATTKNTGGGKAHNNMPPYLAVYMWKRLY